MRVRCQDLPAQAFAFTFDGGRRVRMVLRQRQAIEAALHTLDLARGAARGERLPDGPVRDAGDLRPAGCQDCPEQAGLQTFLDPTSEYWLAAILVLCAAFVGWAIFR